MNLLTDIRGLIKDASLYGLSSGLARVVSIFMAPIITRIFSPADYGVIALIQLTVSFFAIIAGMNLMSGMSYYFYKYDANEDKKTVVTTSFVVLLLFACLMAGGLYLYAPLVANILEARSEGEITGHDLDQYLQIASITLFFTLLSTGIQSVVRLLRQPINFLKIQLIDIFFQVTMVLVLVVWLRYGVSGIFTANAITAFISFCVGLFIIRKNFSYKFSLPFLGLMFAYALPQMPGVLVNWGQSQIGRLALNYYSNMTEMGLYAIAFTVASIFALMTMAFRMACDPYALSIMKRDNAKETYAQIYALYTALFCFLLGGVAIFSKPILMILTPPNYHEAYVMVLYFVTAGFYMGANNILATGIWVSKKTSLTSYAQIFSCVAVVISSLILVPLYGGVGAALSYLCGTIAQSFAYYFMAQRVYHIPYQFYKTHLMVAVVFLISYMNNVLIKDSTLFESLQIVFISGWVITLFLWFYGLSKNNKVMIKGYLSSKYAGFK